jgi:hypothetical protein
VSRVEGRGKSEKMPVLTIEYSDFQDIQVIHDRMNGAKYILSSNVDICMKAKEKLLGDAPVDLFLEELKLQSTRVENLLERTKSGSSLVCTFRTHKVFANASVDARYHIFSWARLSQDE